jgi:hypothetical protein
MDLVCVVAVLLAAPPSQAPASPGALPFSDGRWELQGAAAVERLGEREVLRVETGRAYRRDVSLQDGVIDFDVQVTRRRSFVYVAFRMAEDGEHEEFYLRPHKASLPDALQYAPVWQGQSAWQLHHGPGATAAVDFEAGAWTHVRVILAGTRAALFLGDMEKPALLVPHLARSPRPGYLALRGFLPTGEPGARPSARFANVVVRPGPASLDAFTVPAKPPADAPGVVRAWSVSRSWVPRAEAAAVPELPQAEQLGEWQRLEAQPGGLLELHRFVRLPAGSRDGAALARLHVRAARAGAYAFDLGFSDAATVFVNGRPLFRGEASYSFDAPRRDGLIGYDQARLYLPLEAGDNELAILVSDGFGGWGLMGRFPSPQGLELEAR